MASAANPTTSALAMVPTPGISRSGIHSSSTTKLITTTRLAERDRHVPDQAGVQHVPRRQPEVAAHHHRQRDAVEHQPDVELRQPARQAAGAQLGDRAEVDEAGGVRGRRRWRSRTWLQRAPDWPSRK